MFRPDETDRPLPTQKPLTIRSQPIAPRQNSQPIFINRKSNRVELCGKCGTADSSGFHECSLNRTDNNLSSSLKDLNLDSTEYFGPMSNGLFPRSIGDRRRSLSADSHSIIGSLGHSSDNDDDDDNDGKWDHEHLHTSSPCATLFSSSAPDPYSTPINIPRKSCSTIDETRSTWHVSILSDFQVYSSSATSNGEGPGIGVRNSLPIVDARNRSRSLGMFEGGSDEDYAFRDSIAPGVLGFLNSEDRDFIRSSSPSVVPTSSHPVICPSTSLDSSFFSQDQCNDQTPSKSSDTASIPEEHKNTSRKIFVGRVPKTATFEDVLEFFSQFGDVETADVNAERGCCFVTFVREETVDELLDGKNVHYLDFLGAEQQICIRKYVIIEKDKLFVRGLPAGTSKEDLFRYFKQFGRISHVNLHDSRSGSSPFAFIRFVKPKSVNQIMARNDHEIRGKTIHCLRAHRQ